MTTDRKIEPQQSAKDTKSDGKDEKKSIVKLDLAKLKFEKYLKEVDVVPRRASGSAATIIMCSKTPVLFS